VEIIKRLDKVRNILYSLQNKLRGLRKEIIRNKNQRTRGGDATRSKGLA